MHLTASRVADSQANNPIQLQIHTPASETKILSHHNKLDCDNIAVVQQTRRKSHYFIASEIASPRLVYIGERQILALK